MSGDNSGDRFANGGTSPDLRAQLDELLAAFDEIARFGRERRRQDQNAGHTESTA